MSKAEKKSRKITFGNIMLTLLVLGIFIVIGLMTALYLELSKTPERTAATFQREQQEQAKVEVMNPNNKETILRDANASAPVATKPVVKEKEVAQADNEATSVAQSNSEEKLNTAALQNGGTAPKKTIAQNKNTNSPHKSSNSETASNKAESTIPPVATGEVELKPTNLRANKPSQPRSNPSSNDNVQGEKSSTSRRTAPSERKSDNNNIDALF